MAEAAVGSNRVLSTILNGTFVSRMFRNSTEILGGGILLIVAMLIIPLPSFLLDFFMIINIALGIIIVITTINANKALDIAIFPSLLMFTTLFRIAINVSSTRLILSQGSSFEGQVVRTFADFVVGGNFVVGLVVFFILTIFQMMVINKGSTRVAEVSARFVLEAMPNKQMAIDTDLQSGLITEKEAIAKRAELNSESAFFGSMDGASKYVSGEAQFGILLTVINIIGGIIVGVVIHKEPAMDAMRTYLIFAVGDGLVAQIPAILIAVAMGIIVTRTPSKERLGMDFSNQLFSNPSTLYLAGGFTGALMLIPGFPKVILFLISAALILLGMNVKRLAVKATVKEEQSATADEMKKEKEAYDPSALIDEVKVDAIEIELGYALVPLVDAANGGDLLERIKKQRVEFVREIGFVVPQVRITDNTVLDSDEYCIKMNGSPVGKGHIKVNRLLAINASGTQIPLEAEKTTDPAFGLPAYWIGPEERNDAEKKGYMIADGPVVLSTHLQELIRKNASELLDRKMVRELLDSVRKRNPAVVDEFDKVAKVSLLQNVLRELLSEGIPIRNIEKILEVVTDYSGAGPELISESVRTSLKRSISAIYADAGKNLNALILSGDLANELEKQVSESGGKYFINLSPKLLRQLYESIDAKLLSIREQGFSDSLLICSDILRKPLQKVLVPRFPRLSIMSETEIADGYHINILETL